MERSPGRTETTFFLIDDTPLIALSIEDRDLHQQVAEALESQSYVVASHVDAAEHLSAGEHPDIMIINADKDWENTAERCAGIRDTLADASPLILVVAPTYTPDETLDMLSVIADDVLLQPFSATRLAAHLRLLGRIGGRSPVLRTAPHALLLDRAPAAIMVVDPLGTIVYANDRAHALLFPSTAPRDGGNLMSFVAAESGTCWVNMVSELVSGRANQAQEPLTLLNHRGEPWRALVDAVPVECLGHTGILLTLHDVTPMSRQLSERESELTRLHGVNAAVVTSGISQRLQLAEALHCKIIEPLEELQRTVRQSGDKRTARAVAQVAQSAGDIQRLLTPTIEGAEDLSILVEALVKRLQSQRRTKFTFTSEMQGVLSCPLVNNAVLRLLNDLLQPLCTEDQDACADVFLWMEREVLSLHVEYGGSAPERLQDCASWFDVVALGGEVFTTCADADRQSNTDRHSLTMTILMNSGAE